MIRFRHVAILVVIAAAILAACGPTASGGVEKTIIVGPELVDCVGVAPQKCMLVKENAEDEWGMFYDRIEGFEHEQGYEQVLRIREDEVDNPPADASSLKWTLLEVVSKTKVAPTETTDETQGSEGLEGQIWTLESYAGGEGTTEVLPGTEITAEFNEGRVQGTAGCNSYFGEYQVDGQALTVGAVGMTEMYCMPEETMAQESDYLSALQSAAAYGITDGKLQIKNSAGQIVLTFTTLEPASLTGSLWQLTGYNNGKGGFQSVLNGTEITANFGEDGSLGGSSGCNSYATSYETDEMGGISFGPVASTMMMCQMPEGIMEQEGEYLGILEAAATYQIEGDHLSLSDADGQRLASYTILEPTSLTGSPWEVLSYNNGRGGLASAIAGTQLTADFGEDGSLTGSAGCNNYATSYEIDEPASSGGAISIGPAAVTRMACGTPEGIMEQENAYLAALESAASFEIVADELTLYNAEGTRQVVYWPMAETAGLDEETLANMEYKSEWTQSGTAPLTDGTYEEQAAPGSATMTQISLLPEHTAYGQLNGQEAVAVILATDPGGSGTFIDLAVVVDEGGQPVNVASTNLGDRVQINSVTIEENQIVVDMVAQGPDDAMCCPTQQVVKSYALEGDQLVETGSRTVGSSSDSGLEIVGTAWQWTKFLEANDNQIQVDNPENYTIQFMPDGAVQIKADCNSVGGQYAVNGSQLTIELGPTTLAACPPGSLENEHLALLSDVNSYIMDGENLVLLIKFDTGSMVFAPGP